jgi:hypothetical protein
MNWIRASQPSGRFLSVVREVWIVCRRDVEYLPCILSGDAHLRSLSAVPFAPPMP